MEVVFSMRILFQVICQNHPKPQRLQATSGVCTSPCLCDVFLYPSPNRCLKVKTWVTVVLLQTSDGPCWDFPRGYPIRGSGKTRITMWCGSTINFAKVVVVCQQKELSPSAGSFWDSKKRSVRWVGPYMVGYTYPGYHWNHWPTNHCHLSNIYLDIYIYINIDNENDQKLPTSFSCQIWNIHQLSTPRILRKNQSHRLLPFCWGLSYPWGLGLVVFLSISCEHQHALIEFHHPSTRLRIFVRSYAPRWSIVAWGSDWKVLTPNWFGFPKREAIWSLSPLPPN